jgi:hypothetical protein
MNYMRRMIALGVEGRRERQYVRGTEFHAKATCFAALDDDRNTSFCHESPQTGAATAPKINRGGCDYAWKERAGGVMVVTEYREAEHEGLRSCEVLKLLNRKWITARFIHGRDFGHHPSWTNFVRSITFAGEGTQSSFSSE